MMKATNQIAIVSFVAVVTMLERSDSFVPFSHLGGTQGARMARTFSAGPFDWINDVFGDITKKVEEEVWAAKARAEAEAREKAGDSNAAVAAEAAEAQKQAEEKVKAKRAEEDAANLAKAEAAARLERFEAEQKAQREKESNEAAAKAEAAAAAVAAAKTLTVEETVPEFGAEVSFEKSAQEDSNSVAAKVSSGAEASKQTEEVENAEDGMKKETLSKKEEDSIHDHIEEAAKYNSRITGVVQWYNGGSGFGFIKPYRTEEEEKELIEALRTDRMEKVTDKESATYSTGIFVHHTVIEAPDDKFFRKLYAIESVEFGIGFDKQGRPVAKNVTAPGGDYVKAIVKQQQQRTTKRK